MTWEDAFKKAVQAYFEEGDDDLEISKIKERKYTKKYFDEFEEERVGVKKKTSKDKKDLPNADKE